MLFMHNLYYGKFWSPDGDSGGGTGATGEGDGADDNNGDASGHDSGSDDSGTDDTAGLKSALDKERTDRKTAQKELKTLNARLADLENAGKSDVEKQEKAIRDAVDRAEAAEQRLRDASARVAITEAATKANALSIKAVLKLIEDDLEFNDDGEPTNVAELIAAAKKDEPTLFRASAGSGDGGKTGSNQQDAQPGLDRMRQAYTKTDPTARRR